MYYSCNLPQTKPCGAFCSPIWAGLQAGVHVYQMGVWHTAVIQRRENSYYLLLLPLDGVIHLLGAVWYVSAWSQQKPTGAIWPPSSPRPVKDPTLPLSITVISRRNCFGLQGDGLFPLQTSVLCNAGSVMFTPLSTLLSKWQSSGCLLLAARTCHHGWAIL